MSPEIQDGSFSSSPKEKIKILFAGGGTGGHVFPALSIARELLNISPHYQVEFVGTEQGFESKLVPQEGFRLWKVPVGKLNMEGQLWGKIRTLLRLPLAFIHSVRTLNQVKPQIVMGFGGYVSGPVVLTAAFLGYRTVIWEPNAHPGLTNRWLSYVVDACMIVFEEAKQLLNSNKTLRVGIPVRKDIEDLGVLADQKASRGTENYSSDHRPFRLLIFGGSQGARAINRVVLDFVMQNDLESLNLEVVHQVGKTDYSEFVEKYRGRSRVQCYEFLSPMVKFYDWADAVICRSGASTVAEVVAARKPTLFIPLPWAADDHQKKNALSLSQEKAASMLEQKDLTVQSIKNWILDLMKNTEKRKAMVSSLRLRASQGGGPGAAQKTAQLLVDMIEQQR
jgi:UDP-N-acetylglucosamine--N-acetylmuramyl-(pentapeptide) pyrophosphoryl-undecaprenol N-acetylglucosamine transferase